MKTIQAICGGVAALVFFIGTASALGSFRLGFYEPIQNAIVSEFVFLNAGLTLLSLYFVFHALRRA